MKRLTRSTEYGVFAGVFWGIGRLISVDAVILRILTILPAIYFGYVSETILVYCLLSLVIPEK